MAKQSTESPADVSVLAGELRVVLGQLLRRLREQTAGSDLTRSQSNVLARLEREGPQTATDLARAEGIRPQSMAKIIAALGNAGLVDGSPHPKDGRKTVLRLSEPAQEHFNTGRVAREDWLARAISAGFSVDEVQQLASATKLLKRLTQSR